MSICILILPFLSFLTSNLFGRFIGVLGACLLSTSAILTAFLISTIVFYEVTICSSPFTIVVCDWFNNELFLAS